ncbi:Highly reducing polyketide synthase [Lachnellula occidentalis]|uniref:Highly reducing polyketide synthase n=1 Tax=Lachnellula occidentalis TaxID=215460 RepID=A0A8H8RHI1_9HELO|nr:Highly reducing polyketide synthase [Lachnellula occidentalis]
MVISNDPRAKGPMWMVDHGARHLTYLSRSGGTGVHDEALVTELAAAGCVVQIIAGSVTNLADVRKFTTQATMPIAGVAQMSMVLRDSGFPQMTHEDWMDVASPKVQGTWNLHETFKYHALDFFLLFSSFSGLVRQWGQANYASANTFLDAFVQFRHAAGLPTSVLDIGAMADVGYVSQNAGVMEQFRATAVHILRGQDLLDVLTLSIQQQSQPVSRGKLLDGYVKPLARKGSFATCYEARLSGTKQTYALKILKS